MKAAPVKPPTEIPKQMVRFSNRNSSYEEQGWRSRHGVSIDHLAVLVHGDHRYGDHSYFH